jgi:glycosyltransferase involved in cell wall biosynthesis
MRIAFLSVSDELGGSEIALLDMIAGVGRLRPSWKLHAILPGRGPLLDRATAAGADCTVLPLPAALARVGEFSAVTRRWPLAAKAGLVTRLAPVAFVLPRYVRQLRRILRDQRIALLHTNGVKAHVLGARASGASRLVWHMHEYVGDRGVTRSILRAHAQRPSTIIANSASVADDVERALSLPRRPAVVLNAVDLDSFTPEGVIENLDARAGWTAAMSPVVRVGLIGTFARWKGHETFLQAIAALPSDLPVRAYVIGEPLYDTAGSQYSPDELRAISRQLGVRERVGFTGFLRAAPAMRALDIVVHASTRPEPFGLVIAEAMACGRAVITSATGGAAELVEPGVDALTHAPGNAAELSNAIARLATDADLRTTLGRRANEVARRRFDRNRLATELVAIYEGVA